MNFSSFQLRNYPGPATTLARLAIRVTAVTDRENADTRVVPVFENEQLDGALQALVASGEAKAAPKKTAVFHDGNQRVILVGAGKRDDADAERFRVAAAAAAARAKELGSRGIAWQVPEGATTGIVHGTLLALYSFDTFKSKKDEDGIETLELIGGDAHEAQTAQVE